MSGEPRNWRIRVGRPKKNRCRCPAVAVLGQLDPTDARHLLDGRRDHRDEPAHLPGELLREVREVVVLEGAEGQADRQAAVGRQVDDPPLGAPYPRAVVGSRWLGAPAVLRPLAPPRRVGVGERT
jgi:hypothetical protein